MAYFFIIFITYMKNKKIYIYIHCLSKKWGNCVTAYCHKASRGATGEYQEVKHTYGIQKMAGYFDIMFAYERDCAHGAEGRVCGFAGNPPHRHRETGSMYA
jgi:hypothetical protein